MKHTHTSLRTYILGLVAVFFINQSMAQSGSTWEPAGDLYSDSYVIIKLEYYISKRVCDPGALRSSKWRYNATILRQRTSDLWLTWKMDYVDCNKHVIQLTNNVNLIKVQNDGINDNTDWTFPGDSLYTPIIRNSIRTGAVPDPTKSVEIKVVRVSVPPHRIGGTLSIISGGSARLTEEGGQLALGDRWVWYEDRCGGVKVGEGSSITVRPTATTQYFVRAENTAPASNCTQAQVTVDNNSEAATGIDAPQKVCVGSSARLTVKGGKLGLNAKWLWYSNKCDGIPVGEGVSINVSPTADIVYYVKAQGSTNTTYCTSVSISVIKGYGNPVSVTPSSFVCEGQQAQLSVSEADQSPDREWVWYEGNLNSLNKKYGKTITVSPYTTTQYIVRGEGACAPTNMLSTLVTVKQKSIAATGILGSDYVTKGRAVTFSPNGGSLGESAGWAWYVNSVSRKPDAVGSSYSRSFRKNATLILRAEGACNTTSNVVKTISVFKKTQLLFVNVGVVGTSLDDIKNAGKSSSNVEITLAYKDKISIYVRGKFGMKPSPASKYTTDGKVLTDYTITNAYYKYNGDYVLNRFAITAGTLLGGKNIFAYIGAGYGTKTLLWSVDEYALQGGAKTATSWAKHTNKSIEGIEAEAGVVLRLGFIHVMGGVNMINRVVKTGTSVPSDLPTYYIDGMVGVGFTF
jgi:hypothetical protein